MVRRPRDTCHQAQAATGRSDPEPTGWVGWIVFAGIMMIVVGGLHIFQGLVALFDDDYYQVGNNGLTIHLDYNAWGWTHVIFGVLVCAAGDRSPRRATVGPHRRRRAGRPEHPGERRLPRGVPDLVDDRDRDRHPGDLGPDGPRPRGALLERRLVTSARIASGD